MGYGNIIVRVLVVPQGSGDQVITVELRSKREGEGDQQSNVPSTSDSYLNFASNTFTAITVTKASTRDKGRGTR